MKKALIILCVVIIVVGGLAVSAWLYLPRVAFDILGKATGGTVEAERTSVAFHGGLLVFRLDGIKLKGRISGTVRACELRLKPSRGVYVKYFAVSDFDIQMEKPKGHFAFYPVPVEFARITNGRIDYGGRKYLLREMTVTNFNTGRPLEFTIDGGVEGLGNLKTKGGGVLFPDLRSDINGEYRLSAVHIDKVLKDYEGLADSRGSYTVKDGRLVMDGKVTAPYFSMMEDFLKKRLASLHNVCDIHLERTGDVSNVTLTGLTFKGTPIFLRFTGDPKKMLSLDLRTGCMSIPDVMEYMNPDVLSEGKWGPLSFVKSGRMTINRFAYHRGAPVTARIDVREVEVGNGRLRFTDVAGSLGIDGTALTLDGFHGRLREGRISNVSGLLPLRLDRDVRISGRFSLGIAELSELTGTRTAHVLSGLTEGKALFSGREGKGFSLEGTGTVRDARFLFRHMAFDAAGSYRFKNGEVTLAPLVISESGTKLVLNGKARKDQAEIQVEGVVEADRVGRLLDAPGYALSGPVGVRGDFAVDGGAIRAGGTLSMTDLSFEIPHIARKMKGIESAASVSLRVGRDGDVVVDNLAYTLGPLHASLTGTVGRQRISGMHLGLFVPDVEALSGLFFFDSPGTGGELRADLTLDDLPLPVTRLPRMNGYLSFKNGSLHPPGLSRPVSGINLFSIFQGDRFTVDLTGLCSGGSLLRHALLHVTGLAHPFFKLDLDMDRFDTADFALKESRPFVLPVIGQDELLARTKGEFVLRSSKVRVRGTAGSGLVIQGAFADRTASVAEGHVATAEGEIVFEGSASLASPVPCIDITAHARDVTAAEALALFGGKPDVMEGKGSISGWITLTGRNAEEMAASASGRVSAESKDGVIRRWNIISKILALTNVYDLFAGRVDLTRKGLAYKRLNVSFEGKNGLFHTGNFLIDSPSMLITGIGDIYVPEKKLGGRMTVSPLVTLDKVIDMLPLVRNIIRERASGLLFFVYDIEGPARDPRVTSRFVRSMGSRPLYVLRNAIHLPKGAWDELHKELEQ
jgi:hypothetical protein